MRKISHPMQALTNEYVKHKDDREEKVDHDHDVQRPVRGLRQLFVHRVVSSTLFFFFFSKKKLHKLVGMHTKEATFAVSGGFFNNSP